MVYFHGGGFCVHTAFSSTYNNYLNNLVSEANIIAVSVDYRRAPKNPVPCAHDDSWTAIKWVASHVDGDGPEDWLNHYADFQRVFFAGDSSGANIAHHMGVRHCQEILDDWDCFNSSILLGQGSILPPETAACWQLTTWRFIAVKLDFGTVVVHGSSLQVPLNSARPKVSNSSFSVAVTWFLVIVD